MRILWAGLFVVCLSAEAVSQGLQTAPDLSRNPEWFPRLYKPYVMRKVPTVDLTNSPGLLDLVRDGKLRISLAELENAVRENNLDILSSRNGARYAETDLLRAKGGGAPRGGAGIQIPSSLFAGAIGAGMQGTQGLGTFAGPAITGGARQIYATARGSYDPTFTIGFNYDRTDSPLNTLIVSGVPDVTTASAVLQTRFSQAFATGSSLSVSFNNMRQSSDQLYLLYNPAFVSQFSVIFTQQLLSGFGRTIGRRFLDVARNESAISSQIVRLQVNTTLAQAESTYWNLVEARENLRVADQSLAVARRFADDNRSREELGTSSGLDVVTAEAEVAARERDLVAARAALQMSEVDLENVISKNLKELLGPVVVEPTDALPEPKDSDIPKLGDAMALAMQNRAEILQAEANVETEDIAIRYTSDLLRPSLLFFAYFGSAGLYGNNIVQTPSGASILLPGGLAQSFRQVGNWSYPEYAVGFSFSLNIHSRAAKADAYRAKLERQQSERSLQATRAAIALEVRKAVIGLVQSKAQVEAAHKAVELAGQLVEAEQAKLLEGVTIPYQVILRERDFSSAQSAEVQARAGYAKALVERDRALGLLEPPSKN